MKQFYEQYDCAIDLVIDLIGGKWKVLILWNLNEGTQRFNELKTSLPGITQKMLTQQLRELESHGLVERTSYEDHRVEYSTSDLGKKLHTTLFEMCKWGDQYAEQNGISMNKCWTSIELMKSFD